MSKASSAIRSTQPREAKGSGDSPDRRFNVFGGVEPATTFFAAPSYRKWQRESIEAIEDAFQRGFWFGILEAPTGSGKSHVARAFAFQSGDCHILTVQKVLQDQYERDFPDMFVMKGRSNYRCVVSDRGESCADGPCTLNKKIRPPECPYRLAMQAAEKSPVVVHNFDSFHYQHRFAHAFLRPRKLLVVDEAHNIEPKMLEFLSFTVKSDPELDIVVREYEGIEEYEDFLRVVQVKYQTEYDRLSDWSEAGILSKAEVKRLEEAGSILKRLVRYLETIGKKPRVEYVFDYGNSPVPKVTFRPIYVGDYARTFLQAGERVLMMSGTILDKGVFCKGIGLDPGEVEYLQTPSTFPVRNRPILRAYVGDMSYANIERNLPDLVLEIKRILDRFPNRKGIIQTHSERIAQYIQENLPSARLTFNKDFATPLEMLRVHAIKPGSFIVASGLREGLDLYGDLSKIQVFCKVPYPSLGDKRVKRKAEIDPDWYGYVTAVMFVQALGRSVRSPTERAVTYILDSGFGWFYKKYGRYIPEYIKEAIQWEDAGETKKVTKRSKSKERTT